MSNKCAAENCPGEDRQYCTEQSLCFKHGEDDDMTFSSERIVDGFLRRMIELYDDQGKIPAVKFVREIVNVGLKDAKEFVEEHCENGITRIVLVGKRSELKELQSQITMTHPNITNYEDK